MNKIITSLFLSTGIMVSNGYASVNFVDRHVADAYSNNSVLNNEIQAIPGDAKWNNNGSTGVKNGLLSGNSYWVTFTTHRLDNKLLIQSIVGISAYKTNEVKGGILVVFTNIINDKALPPILSCTKCGGEMKDKPIVGLPVIQAILSSRNQYKGYVIDPISGIQYDSLVMWVTDNGSKLKVNAGSLFSQKDENTWYRIDNSLAEKCNNWFYKQSYSKVQQTEDASIAKDFKAFAYAGENPTTDSLSASLEKLCK